MHIACNLGCSVASQTPASSCSKQAMTASYSNQVTSWKGAPEFTRPPTQDLRRSMMARCSNHRKTVLVCFPQTAALATKRIGVNFAPTKKNHCNKHSGTAGALVLLRGNEVSAARSAAAADDDTNSRDSWCTRQLLPCV